MEAQRKPCGGNVDKVTDFITIRVPPSLKIDYDKLDQLGKKRAKIAVLNALSRVCFAEVRYDASVHFGDDFIVDSDD